MAALLEPFAGAQSGPLAERLIGCFGSLGRALSAPLPQLEAAAGDQAGAVHAIHGARRLVEAALAEELAESTVDGGDPDLQRYIRFAIGNARDERLHVVFCDAARRYLHDETLAVGGLRRIESRARPLFERALALGAGGLLLAHNHPSGRCVPSADDVAATHRLASLAAALEIELIDHLIVTGRRVFSMRAEGCL